MSDPKELIISDFSAASKSANYRVAEDGSLKKRDGTKLFASFDAVLRGAVSARLDDGEVIFAVAGSTLHRVDANGQTTAIGTLTDAVFADENESVTLFMFAGKIYILGGGDYFVSDGTTVSRVEGYVPLIRRACNSSGIGTAFEAENLLTNKVRIRYTPNGSTTKWRIDDTVVSIDAVYVNGVKYTNYTTDIYASSAYVTTSAAISYADDADILEVWYTKSQTSRRSEITSCPHAAVYGGDTDSRVFLYGGERKSVIFPSEPSGSETALPALSGEYFPIDGEITVGDGNLSVSGAVRQFDRLAIFTEDGAFYTYPVEYTTDAGITRCTFPILPLNSDVGATKSGGAVLVENEPYAMSEQGLYRFKSTSVRDERLAVRVEAPAHIGLTHAFMNGCRLHVDKLRGELWCAMDGVIAVYNARLDVWYKFTGIDPDFMLEYAGNTAFAVGKSLYRFDETAADDCGVGFTAEFVSDWLDLGDAFTKKTVYGFGAVIDRNAGAVIGVTLESDTGETFAAEFSVDDASVGAPLSMRTHARLSRASYIRYTLTSGTDAAANVRAVMVRFR